MALGKGAENFYSLSVVGGGIAAAAVGVAEFSKAANPDMMANSVMFGIGVAGYEVARRIAGKLTNPNEPMLGVALAASILLGGLIAPEFLNKVYAIEIAETLLVAPSLAMALGIMASVGTRRLAV